MPPFLCHLHSCDPLPLVPHLFDVAFWHMLGWPLPPSLLHTPSLPTHFILRLLASLSFS